jgi:hypothetical protein
MVIRRRPQLDRESWIGRGRGAGILPSRSDLVMGPPCPVPALPFTLGGQFGPLVTKATTALAA